MFGEPYYLFSEIISYKHVFFFGGEGGKHLPWWLAPDFSNLSTRIHFFFFITMNLQPLNNFQLQWFRERAFFVTRICVCKKIYKYIYKRFWGREGETERERERQSGVTNKKSIDLSCIMRPNPYWKSQVASMEVD